MKVKMNGKIVTQEQIGTGIFSLWLQAEEIAGEARPRAVCIPVLPRRQPPAASSHQPV